MVCSFYNLIYFFIPRTILRGLLYQLSISRDILRDRNILRSRIILRSLCRIMLRARMMLRTRIILRLNPTD